MTSREQVNPAKILEPDATGISWKIEPSGPGTGSLELSGDLKPGWLGKLSSHLSYNKINILKGAARKNGPLCWDASFEIEEIDSP
ncbi:MAG TPA: hypothetical protein VN642_02675 [Dongiaceae bacterium]|nr:hypothetical protein [Dongiaceae bacterium]